SWKIFDNTKRTPALQVIGRHDKEALEFDITRCRYAEFFRALGEPELGALLICETNFALASMVWNTGSSSPGDVEMTCSTSEVAVCCSSALLSPRVRACTSSNNRTFSIAITAWSAKISTSPICFWLKGLTLDRKTKGQSAFPRGVMAHRAPSESRRDAAIP